MPEPTPALIDGQRRVESALSVVLARVRCQIVHQQTNDGRCVNCIEWAKRIGTPTHAPQLADLIARMVADAEQRGRAEVSAAVEAVMCAAERTMPSPSDSQIDAGIRAADKRWLVDLRDALSDPAAAVATPGIAYSGLHPCVRCGLELDADDQATVCGNCSAPFTDLALTGHQFVPSWTGQVCGEMVMREDAGDQCGLPVEDPVHGYREDAECVLCWDQNKAHLLGREDHEPTPGITYPTGPTTSDPTPTLTDEQTCACDHRPYRPHRPGSAGCVSEHPDRADEIGGDSDA